MLIPTAVKFIISTIGGSEIRQAIPIQFLVGMINFTAYVLGFFYKYL